jgi:hypothetical protein
MLTLDHTTWRPLEFTNHKISVEYLFLSSAVFKTEKTKFIFYAEFDGALW